MKLGKQSWQFSQGVYIQSSGAVTGPKENQGPLSDYFDYSFDNLHCDEKKKLGKCRTSIT